MQAPGVNNAPVYRWWCEVSAPARLSELAPKGSARAPLLFFSLVRSNEKSKAAGRSRSKGKLWARGCFHGLSHQPPVSNRRSERRMGFFSIVMLSWFDNPSAKLLKSKWLS
ncbi:uncharacterized protein BDR25DRAFT_392234 [Lindgomyces ingoldianus]|uniref:Uncharacterized protein n=1 Tax=Lindgomyces ingoldianus TaxID=673940 RepID=A0ACB6R4P1_9PLEO|nr:uncharacterized protein BDR25DRAFT_392234 [Lindgomyces ingoldianus]KAF2473798.1 hypothetical protein BDR25DRAFT_392234 [Lindgomyces ingoldianus]